MCFVCIADFKWLWIPWYCILRRPHSFEGVALQGSQINGVGNIIRKCRRYFPKGSSAEIWKEIRYYIIVFLLWLLAWILKNAGYSDIAVSLYSRPMLEDLSHNASLEGAGFISLLMPVNSEADVEFYTRCLWILSIRQCDFCCFYNLYTWVRNLLFLVNGWQNVWSYGMESLTANIGIYNGLP